MTNIEETSVTRSLVARSQLSTRGTLYRINGESAEAEACYQQALELARAIDSPGRREAAAGHTARAETLLQASTPLLAAGSFPAGLTHCRSPPELGEAALLKPAGFAVEGRAADDPIYPEAVRLTSYQVTPANLVTSTDLYAFVRTHKRTSCTFGPDGSLTPKAD